MPSLAPSSLPRRYSLLPRRSRSGPPEVWTYNVQVPAPEIRVGLGDAIRADGFVLAPGNRIEIDLRRGIQSDRSSPVPSPDGSSGWINEARWPARGTPQC